MTEHAAGAAPPGRAYHWLAALPALCLLGGIPFANRLRPFVLGLPFLLFWILLWVVLTSAVMGLVYVLDQRAARRGGKPDVAS